MSDAVGGPNSDSGSNYEVGPKNESVVPVNVNLGWILQQAFARPWIGSAGEEPH